MKWTSKDIVDAYQRQQLVHHEKRIADELEAKNALTKRQQEADERHARELEEQNAAAQYRELEILQLTREQNAVPHIERDIYNLADQEQSAEKLKSIMTSLELWMNASQDPSLDLPDDLNHGRLYVNTVLLSVAAIEKKEASLQMVEISPLSRNKLKIIRHSASMAQSLFDLVDECHAFNAFLISNNASNIGEFNSIVASYVRNGDVQDKILDEAMDQVKKYLDAAQKLVEKLSLLDQQVVPTIAKNLKTEATEIITACNSFWHDEPTAGHLSVIGEVLKLDRYLKSAHDRMEGACQCLADFICQHGAKNPVDNERIPPEVSDARSSVSDVLTTLKQMTDCSSVWPAAPCFSKNLMYAEQFRKTGEELLVDYEKLPRLQSSLGTAWASIFAFASLLFVVSGFNGTETAPGGLLLTGLPAIVIGVVTRIKSKHLRHKRRLYVNIAVGAFAVIFYIYLSFVIDNRNTRSLGLAEGPMVSVQSESAQVGTVGIRTPTLAETGSENPTTAPDETTSHRQEAAVASQFFARRATDPMAEAMALEHLKKAVGDTVREKRNITEWEGRARFQLAALYFHKQDMDRTQKLLSSIFDNDSLENPSETASSFRLLKAKTAEAAGDPKRACESYCNYFRPKLANKILDSGDREIFVRAWRLAIENRENVNLSAFCCFKGSAVEGILAAEDETTIMKIRDMLKPIASLGYSMWIEEIDSALSSRL